MEEFSHQKENFAPKHHQPQRVATIFRSRSCRDREVLSKFSPVFRTFIYRFIMKLRFQSLIKATHQTLSNFKVIKAFRRLNQGHLIFD